MAKFFPVFYGECLETRAVFWGFLEDGNLFLNRYKHITTDILIKKFELFLFVNFAEICCAKANQEFTETTTVKLFQIRINVCDGFVTPEVLWRYSEHPGRLDN